MTVADLPAFWALAFDNPPWRPLSPAEVVILRKSLLILQSLVAAFVVLVAYFVSKKRARAEQALLSYCIELEEALKRSAGTQPEGHGEHRIGRD